MIRIGIDGHNLEKSEYGVAQYVTHILGELNTIDYVRKNYEFIVYFKSSIPKHETLKAENITCKVEKFVRPSFTMYYNFLLPVAARRDKIDVFWFPSYMLPVLFMGRSIVTIHDIVYEDHPKWIPIRYRVVYRVLSRWAGIRASAITTVSNFSKKRIHSKYRTPNSRIHVVYPGVGEVFKVKRSNSDMVQASKKYGISSSRYILFAGQIFTRRYVTESIIAFAHIADRYPDVQFLIIGRNMTSPHVDIDKLCKYYNTHLGRTIFVRKDYAPQSDLNILFQASDAFVYISKYEGFGMPPVEAAMAGRATVTYNYGPLKENIKTSSYLVRRPQKPNSIAEVFREVLDESKDERVKRGEKARKCAKKFTWERSAQSMLKVIQDLVKDENTSEN